MGLQTAHNAFHGSYTEFNLLRCALAAAAGYPVTAGTGPDGLAEVKELADAAWETPGYEVTETRLKGDWSAEPPPEDPLLILLLLSDLEGGISPAHALPLAERIDRLAPRLPVRGPETAAELARQAEQLAAGLRAAGAAGDRLELR